jgi:hypothetical protein
VTTSLTDNTKTLPHFLLNKPQKQNAGYYIKQDKNTNNRNGHRSKTNMKQDKNITPLFPVPAIQIENFKAH